METPAGRALARFKRYLGDGFSLDLPFDAQVERELMVPGVPPEIAADMDSVVRISGMSLDVTDTSAQEGFEREVGPIYDLSAYFAEFGHPVRAMSDTCFGVSDNGC